MGDLRKLKVGIGQAELTAGRPAANERAIERMVERALDAGADALIVPNSLVDASDVRIIGLNDTRIDVAGSIVMLEARGESYRLGLCAGAPACDFTIGVDLSPYTVVPSGESLRSAHVALRPVGMRDYDKKVLVYDGGSSVVAPDGSCQLKMADSFIEDFAVIDFARKVNRSEVNEPSSKLLDALVYALRRFDELVLPYAPNWVIGLSGGLDSSVVASLLVLAFGPERVRAYNMATRYNTAATKSNAATTADALGIQLRNGSIEDLVVSLGNVLVQYGYPQDALKGLVLENAQARARGNLLAAFAAVEGGVIANNGNRVECALGYATLYGDAIGALAPIGDLTKVQLFDVARRINERLGVAAVPENLLPVVTEEGCRWQTKPSAELASGQVDPMKWFYHDWLVCTLLGDGRAHRKPLYDAACDVLEQYADTRLLDTEVARWVKAYGLDDPRAFAEDLDWVVANMQRASFKRIQAPPAVTLASAASVDGLPETQVAPEQPERFARLMRELRSMGV